MNKFVRNSIPGGTATHSFDAAVGPTLMARGQAIIFTTAGILGYSGVVLPHPPQADALGLAAIQLASVVYGALLFLFATRAPAWLVRVDPPIATARATP